MEPKNTAPNFQLERLPIPGATLEAPRLASPELAIELAPERSLSGVPTVAQAVQQAQSATALPAVVVDDQAQGTNSAITSATPLVASDDDLIEKEWVDKAKKIVLETKDDPFRREQEIGRLQIDYVQKRYGRHIGGVAD